MIGLFFTKVTFGQDSANYYSVAYNYLNSSNKVKSELLKLIPKDERINCKKNKSILFICPTINFINLSGYKELLIDSCENYGVLRNEINDWLLFDKKYSFKPYEDSSIFQLQSKIKRRYCLYSSFSKMQGRVLAISVFYNECKKNINPCTLLTSTKFGTALTILLIFDKNNNIIENVFFRQVSLN